MLRAVDSKNLPEMPCVCHKFSILSARWYVTEANSNFDSRTDIQDIPASYRADRFDDLPDFPILVENRRSNRMGVWADNVF